MIGQAQWPMLWHVLVCIHCINLQGSVAARERCMCVIKCVFVRCAAWPQSREEG